MNPKQILIVEDERKTAFTLAKALHYAAPERYRVDVCHTVSHAQELLIHKHFDLVISDLRLPGISGLELIAALRQTHPDTHAILMTAFASSEVEADTRSLTATLLPKPFDIPEALRLIESLLEGSDIAMAAQQKCETQAIHPHLELVARLEDLQRDLRAHLVLAADYAGRIVHVCQYDSQFDVQMLAASGVRHLAMAHGAAHQAGLNAEANMVQTLIVENSLGSIVFCGRPAGLIFIAIMGAQNKLGLARMELRKLAETLWDADKPPSLEAHLLMASACPAR